MSRAELDKGNLKRAEELNTRFNSDEFKGTRARSAQ